MTATSARGSGLVEEPGLTEDFGPGTLLEDGEPVAQPAWEAPAVVALLVVTAALYLWRLGDSGWANAYYSAAAQASSTGWRALFYGSVDGGNGLALDKPAGFVWAMAPFVRLFGLNAWTVLVPQALMGVGSVLVLHLSVRRWFGAAAGIVAGAALAATPVAALMFRYNNPDALLTLALVGAGYAMVRAAERADTRWLAAAGALIGVGFLAKMLQALVVVPGFAAVYFAVAPTTRVRRLRQLLVAGAAIVVTAGWWVALVSITPASSRPFVGGSTDGTLWDLVVGYNGLGRLGGQSTGGGTGSPGFGRLFGDEMGDYVSWLLPAAVILAGVALRATWETDDERRTLVGLGLFGGAWFVVGALTISLGSGIIHGYYTVMLAPPLAAVLGISTVMAWRHRAQVRARLGMSAALVATVGWAWVLLGRADTWRPGLRAPLLVGGALVALVLLGAHALRGTPAVAAAVLAVAIGLGGSLSWTLATAARTHSGSIPLPGPAGVPRSGIGGLAVGATPGGGGVASLIFPSQPGRRLVRVLRAGSEGYTWAAATIRAQQAAGYQLATRRPVLALGGHNGTDPWPTLAAFRKLVRDRRVRYFIADTRTAVGPAGGAGTLSTEIYAWVAVTFVPRTVDGAVVYDLTRRRG